MRFINVGLGNLVSVSRIIAVASPDSAPVRRLIQDSREIGNVIDVSCGKKTQSVIITDSKHVILSGLTTDDILQRLNEVDSSDDDANSITEDQTGD